MVDPGRVSDRSVPVDSAPVDETEGNEHSTGSADAQGRPEEQGDPA